MKDLNCIANINSQVDDFEELERKTNRKLKKLLKTRCGFSRKRVRGQEYKGKRFKPCLISHGKNKISFEFTY